MLARRALAGMVVWFGIGASAPALAQCMDWDTSFARPGFDAEVYVTLEFGGELYAGGLFNWADGVPAHQVARWDGSNWNPVGLGVGSWNDQTNLALGDKVRAMVVHDAGNGPELYVGGKFAAPEGLASNVARWDGSAWQAVGAWPSEVHALAVFDGGAGPGLIAAGSGGTSGRIARWDGSTWVAFAQQPDDIVRALLVHDDGSGPELYAGGEFASVGGLAETAAVAKWNGSAWQAVSPGIALTGVAHALVEFNPGSGLALYALGHLKTPSTASWQAALEWSGGQWQPRGNISSSVTALVGRVFDDGGGPDLYVGGDFSSIGGVSAPRLARWNGMAWSAVDSTTLQGQVFALGVYDAGAGEELYVGGTLVDIGNPTILDVGRIARFDGSSWSAVGNSLPGPNNKVNDLALFDEGAGPVVFAGGNFRRAGQLDIDRIARWDGAAWSPVGSGTDGQVWALEVHDEGAGLALYAGGNFDLAGGVAVGNVARWNGRGWSPVGTLNGTVDCLAAFDAGSGAELYAGGIFTGGVARWDGTSWNTVGLGALTAAEDFAIHDDGSGPALYAAGSLPGMPNAVARLDGSSWTALGSGMDLRVEALASYDAGAGAELYAGGLFNFAGGVLAPNIARWDGGQWQPVGGNVISSSINELTVYDDGAGPELIALGLPTGSLPGAASWDGTAWTGFHGGLDASARASLVVDTELYIAGGFESVDLPRRLPSQRVARFGPATSCPPVVYCTAGTSAAGCQAAISSAGTASASASSGFSLLATAVEGQKDGLFFFGTNGQQANSWGNGTSFQCVVPPVVRAPLMAGTGTVGACDGSFALDLNALWCPSCPKPAKNPGAAAVVQAQLWYRDPLSTSNQTTSLSAAIEFVVGL